MAKDDGLAPSSSAKDGATRRTILAQDRSRATRRKLVRAATRLWAERGFEQGFKDTTVEEIAQAAGLTKGTFYFHFGRKEDILLELGWGAAGALNREADVALGGPAKPFSAILGELIDVLVGRIEAIPRPAVRHSLAEFYRGSEGSVLAERPQFSDAFYKVICDAQEREEISKRIDPELLARMLEAITAGAILNWSRGRVNSLREEIHSQFQVVLPAILAERVASQPV